MPTTLSTYNRGGRGMTNYQRAANYAAGRAANYAGQRAWDYVSKQRFPGKPKKYTRRGLRGAQKVNKLSKQVQNLNFHSKTNLATYTDRYYASANILASANVQAVGEQSITNASGLQTAMSTLRYYDPSNPSVLTTAAADNGIYSRQITIDNVNFKLHARNNYQTPIHITYYVCNVKKDTTLSPIAAWRGILDQSVAALDETQLYSYPTDSRLFKELWSVKKTVTRKLEPGAGFDFTYNTGKFTFDPSTYDAVADTFQKGWKSTVILMKVHGLPGHSGSAVGTIAGGIDYTMIRTTKISYDAGTSLEDFHYDGAMGALPAGVVCNRPVADIQPFSST